MRVAIYSRYSTSLQSAASIEDQIRVCREHAARQGWADTEANSDAAISGANILRPGLQAAMAAAREGERESLLAKFTMHRYYARKRREIVTSARAELVRLEGEANSLQRIENHENEALAQLNHLSAIANRKVPD